MNELMELVFKLNGCEVTKEKPYLVTEAELNNGIWRLTIHREDEGVCELSEIVGKIEGYRKDFEVIKALKCADGTWDLRVARVQKEKEEKEDEEKDGSEEQ